MRSSALSTIVSINSDALTPIDLGWREILTNPNPVAYFRKPEGAVGIEFTHAYSM